MGIRTWGDHDRCHGGRLTKDPGFTLKSVRDGAGLRVLIHGPPGRERSVRATRERSVRATMTGLVSRVKSSRP